jgi:four helix bundle protein
VGKFEVRKFKVAKIAALPAEIGVKNCNPSREVRGIRGNCGGTPRAAWPGMPPRDLIERTRLFALSVLNFCRRLPETREAQEAAGQLRRAANSTRSNYRAARKGRSRAEFQAKLGVAAEEADECVDWLDGRIRADARLIQEARELASILATSVRTARTNTNRIKELPKS